MTKGLAMWNRITPFCPLAVAAVLTITAVAKSADGPAMMPATRPATQAARTPSPAAAALLERIKRPPPAATASVNTAALDTAAVDAVSTDVLGELAMTALDEPAETARERVIAAVAHARVARQRAWLQRHLVDPYLNNADRPARTDTQAVAALTAAADYLGRARDAHGDSKADAWDNSTAAVNGGCVDPAVQFVLAHWIDKFGSRKQGQGLTRPTQFADRYLAAAQLLSLNDALPLLQAEANAGYVREKLRAFGQKAKGDDGTLLPEEIDELRARVHDATDALARPLPDRLDALPLVVEWWMDVAQAAGRLAHDTQSGVQAVDAALKTAGVSEAERALFVGAYHVRWAYDLRGTGFADTVPPDRQLVVDKHFATAADNLERAWQLDPTLPGIAPAMLAVERGQGQGRERMELWFARGRAVDASDLNLYDEKLFYLLPRYYGTADEARAFALWCAGQGAINSQIPLLLADYRYREAELSAADPADELPDLQDPAAWADVVAAYEPYLRDHPKAVVRRSEYLRDAYFGRHWEVVRAQIKALGGEGKYNNWGISPKAYDRCLAALHQMDTAAKK